jgi:thiamine biosynthesis lipoprotein
MRFLESVMGIPMSLDIPQEGDHEAAAAAAFDALREADAVFSTYRDESEISRLNRAEITLEETSPLFTEVVELGSRFERVSGGAFTLKDASGAWDLNGIVKGWAAQRAAQRLRGRGVENFCLNAGGDVVAAGDSRDGGPWNVGIRSPESAQHMIAVLSVRDMAVATSATYERGEHIMDGRTGRPPVGLSSVTVIAEDLMTADVLATTVFVLGLDGPAWAAERYDCSVLAVTESGTFIDAGDLRRWIARGPAATPHPGRRSA